MTDIENLVPTVKCQLFGGASSSPDTPQSQVDASTIQLQDLLVDEAKNAKGRRHFRWDSLCYILHAFLVALHVVLLVISASHHAEHRITLTSDNEAFTIGLSGGLQAFYVLYTALLVFVTQRLALSATFSSPKKLTQIHDICAAWNGLGAALNTLWSQTKVTSSVSSVVLVAMYFACVSVLHVASSTVMQLQPFNGTVTKTALVVATWPSPSLNLSSLNWTTVVASLLPIFQNLYGNATNGLVDDTLYDVPTQSFVSASVNTTKLNAHCGLLTNLSVSSIIQNMDADGPSVNVSMTGIDPFAVTIYTAPLSNEIFLSPDITCAPLNPQSQVCQEFILYLVSTAIEIDESVDSISPVYLNGSYGSSQNISTPMYFVACSLDVSTSVATLGPSGIVLDMGNQPTDMTWSAFSPGGNMGITAGISTAMTAANTLSLSSYCQPLMSSYIWYMITQFDAYLTHALGLGLSTCSPSSIQETIGQYQNGSSLAYYTSSGMPSLLSRSQMESVVSQIAAEFIWLAGEVGSAGGGFDRQTGEDQVTQYMLVWRLNINPLPVIAALCASVILFVLVICMLRAQNSQPMVASAAGVLEIMWLGSRPQVLRDHLRDMRNPSVDSLRASSMFETVFWTRPAHAHAINKEDNQLYAVVPSDEQETHASSSGYLGYLESEVPRDRVRHGTGDLYQLRKPAHMPDNSASGRRWCYILHIVLVTLHVTLIALLVRHPEHSVIIPIESNAITTGLSALLQAFYMIYSALLVVIIQRLAVFRIVSERQKLTTVHDTSGAWTGIGAAICILWQQRQITSSILEIASVVTYLTSMLVLHIGSSSIMQWQAFNTTAPAGVITSDLAFPGSAVNISNLGWPEVFPIVQSIGLDPGMSTHGLSNIIIYDVPHVPINATFSEVSVNATTLDVQCGLLPNPAVSFDDGGADEQYLGTFSLNGTDNGEFVVYSAWKDVVFMIRSSCAVCPQTIFYMMTTGIDVDPSVRDTFTVNMNWTYTTSDKNLQNSTTSVYIAACSVSARTVPATLNLNDYQLVSATDHWQTTSSNSTSWSVWTPGAATNLSVGIADALADIRSYFVFGQPTAQRVDFISVPFGELDSYMMNLLGLNVTFANETAASQSSANPSVTLSPWQLENAIAQTAAKFLWTAGQLGENGGGFTRSVGESQTRQIVLQWRLNLNAIPVVIVSLASFTALGLVPFIIGTRPSKECLPSVSGTSVLECLWLESHSEALHSRLKAVEEPLPERLRAAGMFDIVLGDIGRSSLTHEDVDNSHEDAEMNGESP